MEWPGRRGIRTSYIRACRDLPGRAAHGERERYLAKGWLGSDRVGKERSQLPAATTTATNPRRPGRQRPELQPGQQTGPARTPSATVAQPPRGRPFPLDRLFQERSHRPPHRTAGGNGTRRNAAILRKRQKCLRHADDRQSQYGEDDASPDFSPRDETRLPWGA